MTDTNGNEGTDVVARARANVDAMRHEVDRLRALVGGLDEAALRAPSDADGWSIAQVCSHLGSGSEIFGEVLAASLEGREPPPQEHTRDVWARWDAMAPVEQRDASLAAQDAYVGQWDAIDDDALAAIDLWMYGFSLDAFSLSRFRLGEAGLHTWDVAVALDRSARVSPELVEILVDWLPDLFFLAKPNERTWTMAVETTAPDRRFVISASPEGSRLLTAEAADEAGAVGESGVDGRLACTSEVLVRLVYHRVEADTNDGATLDSETLSIKDVHAVFPGV